MDKELEAVHAAILKLDSDGSRTARVLRNTLDQLYDGQRTGRYRWDQLYKTEKTHCGTLVEINLHREFEFEDGKDLDYKIAGVDVDCKYSQGLYEWMIPQEAREKLCLVVWADDQKAVWKMGVVRARAELLGALNRDQKARLNSQGKEAITWIFQDVPLPPNVLLQLDPEIVDKIMGYKSGQKSINELFRNTLGMRVGRGVIATVAQQNDYMKRVRGNGGARTALQPEGIIILGQYESHREIARNLGVQKPERGESISVKLAVASPEDKDVAMIAGRRWRIAKIGDPVVPAPMVPKPPAVVSTLRAKKHLSR